MVTGFIIDGPSDSASAPGRHGPELGKGRDGAGLDALTRFGPGARHNGGVPDVTEPDVHALDGGRPRSATVGVTDEIRAERESELRSLIELMRPSVQADGGDLELVSFDVESGVVEVQLQGACSSCAISSATLQGGVDRILRGRLDWVTEVLGGVDENADPFESATLGRGAYVPKL
jgi:Fe-S cluster biogenesis protein NfuA